MENDVSGLSISDWGKHMLRMIVTDLDNTLLNSQEELSDYTCHVLNCCHQRGIQIAFATARPERATRLFQQNLQWDYIVSNNGAAVQHHNKIVFNRIISHDLLNQVVHELNALKAVTCLSVETGKCLYTTCEGTDWGDEWHPIHTDFREQLHLDFPKISVETSNAETLRAVLKKYSDLYLFPNRGENWYQIMCRNVSKENGIQFILQETGLQFSNVVAFGDDENDIGMLKRCGEGVAVANGSEAVKSIADSVCESNDANGVALWIKHHIMSR